jgi:lipoprotein-releasing system permease protein
MTSHNPHRLVSFSKTEITKSVPYSAPRQGVGNEADTRIPDVRAVARICRTRRLHEKKEGRTLLQAQALAGKKGQVSAIGLWIEDVFNVKQVKENLTDILQYPYYSRDWMEINKSLFSALKLEKAAMFIILTLIILVAAFNIASALIMMVMEKTKDIAVLKAMGATNKTIRRIFILKGMIIGLLGTFIGTISGVIICFILKKYDFIQLPDAYPFSTLPVQLEYLDVFIISISAIIICFFSTLYPSYKASKMDTVEALRYG